VTETLILTQMLTSTADMTKALLLQPVQMGASFMFCQDYRTLEILVVSIISLEVPED